VAFESGVFLLLKARAERLKQPPPASPEIVPPPADDLEEPKESRLSQPSLPPESQSATHSVGASVSNLRLTGTIPPEVWNRIGTRLIPKLRTGTELSVHVEFQVEVKSDLARGLETDLRLILEELELAERLRLKRD
jgi:hypothetical protein